MSYEIAGSYKRWNSWCVTFSPLFYAKIAKKQQKNRPKMAVFLLFLGGPDGPYKRSYHTIQILSPGISYDEAFELIKKSHSANKKSPEESDS